MNNTLKKNLIINFVITLIVGIFAFVINKYFVIYLGIEKLGVMNLFNQLLVYVTLVETGLGAASTYALYKPLAQKDYTMINIVISTITSIYNKIFILILMIGLSANLILPYLFRNVVFTNDIYIYWSLYVINTASSYILVKYVILFTADQRFGFVRLVQGIIKICCQILQLIVIIKFKSFYLFIILMILSVLFEFIFYRAYFRKNYTYVSRTDRKDRSIGKNMKRLICHKIGGLVVSNTDFLLISKFISIQTVGIYASYQMITATITKIFDIVFKVLEPMVGKYLAEVSIEDAFEFWKKLNIFFLFCSTIFSYCTYKLISKFIYLWLGKEFLLSPVTVSLLCINLFVVLFRQILDIFKNCFGFFKDVHLPILEAFINLVLSLILVLRIGLNGIIIGTIVSNIIIICIARPILVFKCCFKKNIRDYIKIYGNYVILVAVTIVILEVVANFFFNESFNEGQTYWHIWLMESIAWFLLSFIITFIIFFYNTDFRMVVKKVFSNYYIQRKHK